MSTLEQVDFQSIIHQDVTHYMAFWAEQGMPDDACQENAGQLFNMGGIASQQLLGSPQIQIENAPDPIDLTPELAEQILKIFLSGLQANYLQAYKYGVPAQESMEIIQNVALHVFEQSKNIAVAVMSQPDQVSQDQMYQWINQTASEAFTYYLSEMEKERGSLMGKAQEANDPMTQTLQQAEAAPEIPADVTEHQVEDAMPMAAEADEDILVTDNPTQTQEQAPPTPVEPQGGNTLYQQVALGLYLSSMNENKRQWASSFYSADELKQAQPFFDTENVPVSLDMTVLVKTIQTCKQDLKQRVNSTPKRPSDYRRGMQKIIQHIPEEQVQQLFAHERGMLKTYVSQFHSACELSQAQMERLSLPLGVMETLVRYLKTRFPDDATLGQTARQKGGLR